MGKLLGVSMIIHTSSTIFWNKMLTWLRLTHTVEKLTKPKSAFALSKKKIEDKGHTHNQVS